MNWYGWWQWAIEHKHRELGLLFLFLVSYIPMGFLTAGQLFRNYRDNPMAARLAWFFLGVAIMGTCGLIANIDPPSCQCPTKNVTYSLWFAWWYWPGNGVLLITTWAMRRFALYPHNGSANHEQK